MPWLPALPSTVLVAPDAFKGTLGAAEVAEAVGRGLEVSDHPVDRCPVADGGEGTFEVMMAALSGERIETKVTDPLGRTINACFGRARLHGREVAIVEAAAASGLVLVGEQERDPIAATTFGTGELIVAAIAAGAQQVYLGVGGSATTDGGRGAIDAIVEGGGLQRASLVVLCDVRVPFEQAARVFGPQKGADEDDVDLLSSRLHELAGRLERDPRGVPMTGAAGGLSGGLWGCFGAELVAGASYVLDMIQFDRRMRAARAVVTGEGKLDRQSLAGKAVSEVATRARQGGVPCHAIVGVRELDAFGARMLDLQAILEAGTLERLTDAARRLAGML